MPANLALSHRNFRLHGLTLASLLQRFIGGEPRLNPEGVNVATVDQLAAELDITDLHVLHSDIQPFERSTLDGARNLIARSMIDYLFISTHGNDIYDSRRSFLVGHRFDIIMDVPQATCFSIDGILVARRRGVPGPDKITVARLPMPTA